MIERKDLIRLSLGVYRRYQSKLISEAQAKREAQILQALLREMPATEEENQNVNRVIRPTAVGDPETEE